MAAWVPLSLGDQQLSTHVLRTCGSALCMPKCHNHSHQLFPTGGHSSLEAPCVASRCLLVSKAEVPNQESNVQDLGFRALGF